MKKKIIFVVGIVLLSMALATGIGFLAFAIRDYTTTMDQYEQIEADKTLSVNKADTFENQAKKHIRAVVDEDEFEGYEEMIDYKGIKFISHVEDFDKDMLEEVAEEFFRNTHGEEINYVERLEIFNDDDAEEDDEEDDDDDEYPGPYTSEDREYEIPISLYGFIGTYNKLYYTSEYGVINLFYGEHSDMTILAYLASTGYGHHFTQYYFDITGEASDDETEYYRLRADGNSDVKLEEKAHNDYWKNYEWYLTTLAVSDYVYFMGSETTKEVVRFYDTKEKLDIYLKDRDETKEEVWIMYRLCRNGTPHENLNLPMPHEVEGLKEYFFSFLEDEEAPEYTETKAIGDLNLQYIENPNWTRAQITWDMPYTDADVAYTLLVFDEDDYLWFMQKTVYGDEVAEAYFGYYLSRRYYTDTGDRPGFKKGEILRLRVSITFPDGTVIISDAIEIIYKEGMN